jgi:adenylate kinase
LNVDVIDTGNVLREIILQDTPLGRRVKEYVDNGMLVPNDVVFRVLMQLVDEKQQKGFILDGYPRTLEQVMTLACITKIDAVIHLVAPDWLLTERMINRRVCTKCKAIYNLLLQKVDKCTECGGKLVQRTDDTHEAIQMQLEVFYGQEKPILQYFRRKGIPIIPLKMTKRESNLEADVEKLLSSLRSMQLA